MLSKDRHPHSFLKKQIHVHRLLLASTGHLKTQSSERISSDKTNDSVHSTNGMEDTDLGLSLYVAKVTAVWNVLQRLSCSSLQRQLFLLPSTQNLARTSLRHKLAAMYVTSHFM